LSDVVIRPVGPDDVKDLQRNCFPRSTHDEVHRLVEASLRGAIEGRYIHLVAEDDGEVVGRAGVHGTAASCSASSLQSHTVGRASRAGCSQRSSKRRSGWTSR